MSLPESVKAGDPLSATWANQVVDSLRASAPAILQNNRYPVVSGKLPFDICNVVYSGDWRIQLIPGYFVRQGASSSITQGGTALEEFPEIPVENAKDLYLDLTEKELVWKSGAETGFILVLKFVWESGSFSSWENKLKSSYFTELPEYPEDDEKTYLLSYKAGELSWIETADDCED